MEYSVVIVLVIFLIIFIRNTDKKNRIKEHIKKIDGHFDSFNYFETTAYGYNTIEGLKLNPLDKEQFYSVNYYDKNNNLRKMIVSISVDLKLKVYEDKIIKTED